MRLATLSLAVLSLFAKAQNSNFIQILPTDSKEDIIRKAANVVPTDRQLRWQNLELTAFIHFGINTYTGREWGNGNEDPKLFNPTNLDTDQWVRELKEAGFKQIILTAKHHDGFCLWPTKTTEHSLKNSPWKNGNGDVMKEFAQSCRKYGVGIGVYLSPWDMNADTYGTEAYNDFFVEQLTELLTQYGEIHEVWFDGANGEGKNGKKQVYDFERWYRLIRKLQPKAVIAIMGPDVRWVGTETGVGRSQEWSVVPADQMDQSSIAALSQKDMIFKPLGDMRGDVLGDREKIYNAKSLVWYPAETDVSIQDGWFFNEKHKTKTPQRLNDIYYTSVGMNGVLLLNIPPDKRGLIRDNEVQVLKDWTKMRKETFENNLLKNSKIYSNDFSNLKKLTDNKNQSQAITKKKTGAYEIEFSFKEAKTFNVVMLQENIKKGQRVEAYKVYYWENEGWKLLTEATTIGYKRLLRTPKTTSERIKIVIEQSRLEPHISEVGLYLDNSL